MVVKPLIAWSLLYKSLISDWCYHNKQRSLPDWVREQGNQQKPEVVQRRNLHANQAFHETHHGVTPPQIHLGGGRSNYPNPNFQAAFHIICQFWLLSLLASLTESLNYLDVGFCFFFPQEDYWQMPRTAWFDLHTSNQPTAKQGAGSWGQNSASYLPYFLLNFFPIQLTKLCNYTFIGQEISVFPFLASFSVALPCFTGYSKLNIAFKLHNKDLGVIEWMRKVTGREVSAKIRFAK